MSLYQPLHSGEAIPAFPPAYEDREPLASENFTSPHMEQFEIDEDEVYEPVSRESLLKRTIFATKKAVFSIKNQFGGPFKRCFDPISEGYAYFNMKYELLILKLGNPLVVKRLIYVFFVILIINLVTKTENSEGVNGASGGAFSLGKFYDVDMLANTMKQYIEAFSLKENIEYLSSMPHFAGTTGDLTLARYVESYFNNNGIQVIDFHELDCFLNYPKRDGTYLKTTDGSFSATLHEGDGDEMQNLAFNPTSPSTKGEITAKYVYANHGDPKDFVKLENARVLVKDCIVLMHYGGSTPEPNKVLAATKLGAKAVVFISPSIEYAGKLHEDMIQRVNVGLTRVSYGDVLTPGWSSHSNYFGSQAWDNLETTAKIPTIPILWKDGSELIKRLGKFGAHFGDEFYSGDKSEKNELKLSILHEERNTHLIWNVVGSIRGREQADKGIIFGAARDSTGYGAATSASSTATLLELVKVFTSLQRRYDWYPSRTIYFASFDATEYNLGGSGEWMEEKRQQLAEEGYAYIDVSDIATGDDLTIKANPLVLSIIRDELKHVELTDSQKSKHQGMKTLYDLYKEQHEGKDLFSNNMIEYKNYLPFINAINIPSIDIGFRGQDVPVGSALDNFHNMDKTFDSSMKQHIQIVELLARIGLRLAEDPMLSFDFVELANRFVDYQKDLESYVNEMKAEFSANVELDFGGLLKAIKTFKDNLNQLDEFRTHWKDFIKSTSSLEPAMLANSRKALNDRMMDFSYKFISQDKQHTRIGYQNYLFGVPYDAPPSEFGMHEWNTFLFVRDHASLGDFTGVQNEINRIAELITSVSESSFRIY